MTLKSFQSLFIAVMLLPLTVVAAPQSQTVLLDLGFQRLYNLDFSGAQADFGAFERDNPDDPMGPVSEAAAYVFSELNRLGILESRLFTQDSVFRSRTQLTADPNIYKAFNNALLRTDTLVSRRLAEDRQDRNALFAKTLAAGLRADYTSLIEDRNVAALRFTREATSSAQELLAICPDCYDAYVASGVSEYLIGSLSPPLRWIVRLGGFSGNKSDGIRHLRLVAERGHYLAPFARILLALAYVREGKTDNARSILSQLQMQFPANPLFPRELARLQHTE